MIDTLEGTLGSKNPEKATVQLGGIGLSVQVPLSTFSAMPDPGEPIKLYTHLYVREDQLRLYGFATIQERQLFQVLLDVNRIGPGLAKQVLSSCSVDKFKDFVAAGDVKALASMVKGVGKKTAQRMVLELKGELANLETEGGETSMEGTAASDAVKALVEIGVNQGQARKAVEKAFKKLGQDASSDVLVNEALAQKN